MRPMGIRVPITVECCDCNQVESVYVSITEFQRILEDPSYLCDCIPQCLPDWGIDEDSWSQTYRFLCTECATAVGRLSCPLR